MSRAPSEKHLEEWIVKHPDFLPPYPGDWAKFGRHSFHFIDTQIRLPSGVADIIAVQDWRSLAIIELKKGRVDSKALAQVMKYMRDLRVVMPYGLAEIRDPSDPRLLIPDPDVRGILIGRTLGEKHLLAAASVADVSVYTYDYDESRENYNFELLLKKPPELSRFHETTVDVIKTAAKLCYVDSYHEFVDEPETYYVLHHNAAHAPLIKRLKETGEIGYEYDENGLNAFPELEALFDEKGL